MFSSEARGRRQGGVVLRRLSKNKKSLRESKQGKIKRDIRGARIPFWINLPETSNIRRSKSKDRVRRRLGGVGHEAYDSV